MKYPKSLQALVSCFQKLPGVGAKTAERFGFDMIEWSKENIHSFINQLTHLQTSLSSCKVCNALIDITENTHCKYCDTKYRNSKQLCVLSSQKDLFAVESTHTFLGMYHVLPGLLSPINNFSPDNLNISAIKHRIKELQTEEIILAIDSTIEGDATALFLKKELNNNKIKISRLALGIPIGSSLDFIDEGTLSRALSERTLF